VRGLFGLVETDLEGVVRELEGVCVLREHLLLVAVERAIETLEQRLRDPGSVLEAFKILLREAKLGSEIDLARYGIWVSDAASALVLEAEAYPASPKSQAQVQGGQPSPDSKAGEAET